MAIEIAFGIRGKETAQALFIQESDWEISLSKLRQLIEEQTLHVPLEYKFLTLKDNAIAHPAEENIVLKEIVSYTPNGKEDEELKLEDFGMTSEIGEAAKKTLVTPKIWITPLKVTYSSANQNGHGAKSSNGTNATEEDGEGEDTENQNEDDPLIGNSNQQCQGGKCLFCPYRFFKDILQGKSGPPDPKSVLKIVFILGLILFTLLATLTLCLHMMMTSLISVSSHSGVADLLFGMGGGNGGAAVNEMVSKLELRLSQLEMSSKFELDHLTSKMAELEDLYLHDLAIHKKELSLIKQKMAAGMNDDLSDVDLDEAENVHTRGSAGGGTKDFKRKPGSGKMHDRKG